MKRFVLLVAIFVFALTLAVPAFVSVGNAPASADARITNTTSVDMIAWFAADPECPPGSSGGTGNC